MAIVIAASKLTELLRTANEHKSMYVRVLSASRLALGIDPDRPTLVVDLSKEKIIPYDRSNTDNMSSSLTIGSQSPPASGTILRSPRRTGDYWFVIKGHRVNCGSLKELLCQALRALEEAAPGMLEQLSNVKPRSRRIVARDRNHLFDKRHLTDKYAKHLMPGWWYGTNNSADETKTWLKHACDFSKLEWGVDFSTSLNERVSSSLEEF